MTAVYGISPHLYVCAIYDISNTHGANQGKRISYGIWGCQKHQLWKFSYETRTIEMQFDTNFFLLVDLHVFSHWIKTKLHSVVPPRSFSHSSRFPFLLWTSTISLWASTSVFTSVTFQHVLFSRYTTVSGRWSYELHYLQNTMFNFAV